MHSPTSQGVLYRVNSEAADWSKTKVVLLWFCKNVAGTSELISPWIVLFIISALFWPQAINTILLERRIVETPMVIALLGTLSIPLKSKEASTLVMWSKVMIRVPELMWEPGSLKPTWPVRPIPNNWKSSPPGSFSRAVGRPEVRWRYPRQATRTQRHFFAWYIRGVGVVRVAYRKAAEYRAGASSQQGTAGAYPAGATIRLLWTGNQ